MQTLGQIRRMLEDKGLTPHKRYGQNFLFDHNLMGKLLDLADLTGTETVLEVGPGTGSLTEELLARAGRVVAIEIDRGLHELLRRRFEVACRRLGLNRRTAALDTSRFRLPPRPGDYCPSTFSSQ